MSEGKDSIFRYAHSKLWHSGTDTKFRTLQKEVSAERLDFHIYSFKPFLHFFESIIYETQSFALKIFSYIDCIVLNSESPNVFRKFKPFSSLYTILRNVIL